MRNVCSCLDVLTTFGKKVPINSTVFNIKKKVYSNSKKSNVVWLTVWPAAAVEEKRSVDVSQVLQQTLLTVAADCAVVAGEVEVAQCQLGILRTDEVHELVHFNGGNLICDLLKIEYTQETRCSLFLWMCKPLSEWKMHALKLWCKMARFVKRRKGSEDI